MDYGDIVVNAEPTPPSSSPHGYVEYRIAVTNRSAKESHQVRLTIPKISYPSPGNRLRSITRTVQVSPGSTVQVGLLQPSLSLAGEGLEVAIDGKTQSRPVAINLLRDRGARYGGGAYRTVILMSRTGAAALAKMTLLRSTPGEGVHRGEVKVEAFPYSFPVNVESVSPEAPVSAWAADWLAYSSYDGVVIAGTDLPSMPPAVRSALWQYVECGGSLLVAGPGKVPERWHRGQTTVAYFTSYHAGFGQCLVTTEDRMPHWDQSPVSASWARTRETLSRVHSVTDANRTFPVVENLSVPVRGLFVLMIAFAIVIGPVNVAILTRKKRRIWLLWTVPALSLATCVVVFGYLIFTEGWHGHTRTEALTVLDEPSRRAATVGWAGYYSPLTPGAGLHFEASTELTPQLASDHYGPPRSGDSSRTIDWTHDQHLASGWVTARVPAYFKLRKSEVRRERVTVRRGQGGALTVVNGLGAAIDQLWLADLGGKMYTASHIPPGGEAVLAPREDSARAAGKVDVLRQLFASSWTTHYPTLTTWPEQYLQPGCYLAALEGTPFVEDALTGAERKGRSLVYGIMREPVHAD